MDIEETKKIIMVNGLKQTIVNRLYFMRNHIEGNDSCPSIMIIDDNKLLEKLSEEIQIINALMNEIRKLI